MALKILKGEIKTGDKLHYKGHTTDFVEKIKSIQIEHNNVEKAKAGDSIGIKIENKVRKHDKVYKVTE